MDVLIRSGRFKHLVDQMQLHLVQDLHHLCSSPAVAGECRGRRIPHWCVAVSCHIQDHWAKAQLPSVEFHPKLAYEIYHLISSFCAAEL